MKRALTEGSPWTRRRFLALVGVLFVLQVGLIFLFGARLRPRLPHPATVFRVRALGAEISEDELLRQFFVSDPAVFPLPNRHGFSGRAWLNQPPMQYSNNIQLEPPAWLALETNRLGVHLPVSHPNLTGLSAQPFHREEPLPDFLTPEVFPTNSVFRLEGKFSERLLGGPPVLRGWPVPQPWKKPLVTTVQIAVSPEGEVLAAQLLNDGCGVPEADAEAVARARALRFRPSPSAGTQWGQAIFQWQPTEPAPPAPAKP